MIGWKPTKQKHMTINTPNYWEDRYDANLTGWDMGKVSPPLKDYFDQLKDKSLKILITQMFL